jgi:hypothetical protein
MNRWFFREDMFVYVYIYLFFEYPGGELILWKLQLTTDGQSAWKMHKSLLYVHYNTNIKITIF